MQYPRWCTTVLLLLITLWLRMLHLFIFVLNICEEREICTCISWNSSTLTRRWWFTHNDDVIKWKHFPRYWPFVRGIHPHKGQWSGALMFSLICALINDWVNNGEAGDLRRHRVHYDVIVMFGPGNAYRWYPAKRALSAMRKQNTINIRVTDLGHYGFR